MRDVLIGQTDYTVLVKIVGTDGNEVTGLTNASIDIAYCRVETDNDVTTSDVTPASLSALTDAHSDWGFKEVSSTDHPGLYRLDIADAVFASGAWEAVVTITDASGEDFYSVDIGFRLVNIDPQAAVLPANVTQFGGSAGTFASGRPEVNTSHIAGSAVSTSTAQIGVNVVNFGGSAGTFSSGRPEVNTTHAAGTAWGSGAITAGAIASGAITSAKFAAGAIDAAAIANGAIDAATFAADVDAEILSYLVDDATRIDASALNTATGTTIPAILDDTDLIDDGTSGLAKIATDVAAILVDTGTTLQAELDGIQADTEDIQSRLPAALVGGRIDATIDATGMEAGATAAIADAVWEEAIADHSGTSGSTAESLNAAGGAGDPWTTTLPGSYTGSQAGKILSDILVDTGTTLQGELDGIQADTEDIQSRLPAALTADGNIKADALRISGSATAADNVEQVFDTDFADVYNATDNHWHVDVQQVKGSATAAQNMTTVFATDFATNYDSTNDKWNTRADLQTIKGQTVTCAAGVTVYAHVGTSAASTAQSGDAYAYLGTNLGLLGANATEAGGTGDQFTAIPWNASWDTEVQSEVADALTAFAWSGITVGTVTTLTNLPAITSNWLTAAGLATDAAAEIATAVLTTQMTESYRATGAAPTLAQAQFEVIAHLGNSAIASTTKTAKKLDGSTTAKTYTLDSATVPTSITEAT